MNRCVGLLLILLALAACRLDSGDWGTVTAGIRRRFPDVDILTTEQLPTWLAAADTVQPVLLDVRQAREFDVSHLAGAVHAPNVDAAVVALGTAALDTPIVTYCSVGYRSAGVAEQLRQRGYTRVLNLQGSLFQWANEGRPMVDTEGPVRVVHPYGDPWSGLLDEKLRWQKLPTQGPTVPSE